jgi:hypothetical protein
VVNVNEIKCSSAIGRSKGQRYEKKLLAAVRNKRMIASSVAPNFSLQLLLRARI